MYRSNVLDKLGKVEQRCFYDSYNSSLLSTILVIFLVFSYNKIPCIIRVLPKSRMLCLGNIQAHVTCTIVNN